MFRARYDDGPRLTLDAFIAAVERTLVVDSIESMEACAPYLAGYAKTPDILPPLINDYVARLLDKRAIAPIRTPQSLLIAVRDDFYIRCNIWAPIKSGVTSRPYQERLYSLEVPHDHNFSFLTVGYLGPGYVTDLYRYDRASVKGEIGERVEMVPAGRYTLGIGDVMLYRQGVDIHIQHQPAARSASINLMFLSPYNRRHWQYMFDLDARTISGRSGNAIQSRHELIMLAGEIGNAETAAILGDIVEHCPCGRTRQAGAAALAALARDKHAARA